MQKPLSADKDIALNDHVVIEWGSVTACTVVLKFSHNTSVSFEVIEHILPTFTIKINPLQKYILQSLDDISGSVAVNYTYGKAVTGTVGFKYGVKDPKDNRSHYFGSTSAKQLRNGFAEYTLSTNKLRQTPFAWFPTVVGYRLVVEVSVHETVTGRKERTIDDSVVFVTTPYVISFKDTFTDFKPNAQINNVLGEVVPNLPVCTTVSVGDIYHSQIVVNGGTISNVLHLVVLNRGNIIHTQMITDNKLRIEITREMTPYIRVMVLGFANDGKQLVSDSLKIYVNEEKCAFDVRFDNDMVDAKPGQQLNLLISGSIGNSIGLLAIDEAVYHLRDKDKLTRSKLYNELSKSDTGCGPGTGLNVLLVANNMGVKIINGAINDSNANWDEFCVRRRRQRTRRAIRGGREGQGVSSHISAIISELNNNNEMCCELGKEEGSVQAKNDVFDDDNTDDDFVHVAYEQEWEDRALIRSDFRQTWLFDIVVINQTTTVHAVTLPHSITTWSLSAMSLSADNGFCIQPLPVKLRSFQDIFLDISMPPSVVQNEHLEAIVSVFNHSPKRVSVTVYTYRVDGICSEAETDEDRPKRQIRVDSNSLKTVSYPMVAIRSGVFAVKFVAVWSAGGADVVVKVLRVRPPGVEIREELSVRLDPRNRQRRVGRQVITDRINDEILQTISLQKTIMDITPDPIRPIVPGTQQCIITGLAHVYGGLVPDLPTPGFHRQHNGIETMLRIAHTLFTMKYLKSIDRLNAKQAYDGLRYLKIMYKKLLSFRKTDGSFSPYTSPSITRPSSVYLTASVAKVLCQANRFVNNNQFDSQVIRHGIQWLMDRQDRDGSWTETQLLNTHGLGDERRDTVPLTASVLIAIQKCIYNFGDDNNFTASAETFLMNTNKAIITPNITYLEAIVAYSLRLRGHRPEKAPVVEINDHSSATTAAVAYTLMTLSTMDKIDEHSWANWLNAGRNTSAIAPVTEDTVTALEALSVYNERTYRGQEDRRVSLVCNITTDSGGDKRLAFNDNNAPVLQTLLLDATDVSRVIAMTTGVGMARLSVTMKYNVFESPDEPLCRFDVSVSADEWTAQSVTATEDSDYLDVWTGGQWVTKSTVKIADTNNYTFKRINNLSPEPIETTDSHRSKLVLLVKLCVQHMPASNAGLTVIDVGVFTGFTPNGHDLREIVSMNHSLVTAYEMSDRNVVFYMRYVPFIQPYCLQFRSVQVHYVTNTQAALVKVYEYNNQGDSCTQLFTPAGRRSDGIDTVCDNSTQLCDCVQRSNCPSAKRLVEMGLIAEMRVERARQLFDEMVCSPKFSRVFTATISGHNVTKSGLKLLSVRVKHVLKSTLQRHQRLVLNVNDECSHVTADDGNEMIVFGHFSGQTTHLDSTCIVYDMSGRFFTDNPYNDMEVNRGQFPEPDPQSGRKVLRKVIVRRDYDPSGQALVWTSSTTQFNQPLHGMPQPDPDWYITYMHSKPMVVMVTALYCMVNEGVLLGGIYADCERQWKAREADRQWGTLVFTSYAKSLHVTEWFGGSTGGNPDTDYWLPMASVGQIYPTPSYLKKCTFKKKYFVSEGHLCVGLHFQETRATPATPQRRGRRWHVRGALDPMPQHVTDAESYRLVMDNKLHSLGNVWDILDFELMATKQSKSPLPTPKAAKYFALYVCAGARLLVSDPHNYGTHHNRSLVQQGGVVVVEFELKWGPPDAVVGGTHDFKALTTEEALDCDFLVPKGGATKASLKTITHPVVFLGPTESKFETHCWGLTIAFDSIDGEIRAVLSAPQNGVVTAIRKWKEGMDEVQARHRYEQLYAGVVTDKQYHQNDCCSSSFSAPLDPMLKTIINSNDWLAIDYNAPGIYLTGRQHRPPPPLAHHYRPRMCKVPGKPVLPPPVLPLRGAGFQIQPIPQFMPTTAAPEKNWRRMGADWYLKSSGSAVVEKYQKYEYCELVIYPKEYEMQKCDYTDSPVINGQSTQVGIDGWIYKKKEPNAGYVGTFVYPLYKCNNTNDLYDDSGNKF
ncbi:unnamed protein product, partial [Medioppia subpectinata]